LLAVEALKFAREQSAISARTRTQIGIALASARRDLANISLRARAGANKRKQSRSIL
jgi:hypothetical protein